MKILVVDDHRELANISCRLLREVYGHEVRMAETGATALQAASAEVPDLVLLDIDLPDMSGYEVARKLRFEPELDRTLLVAVTGYACFVEDTFSRAMGLDACFRKPMNFDEIARLRRR